MARKLRTGNGTHKRSTMPRMLRRSLDCERQFNGDFVTLMASDAPEPRVDGTHIVNQIYLVERPIAEFVPTRDGFGYRMRVEVPHGTPTVATSAPPSVGDHCKRHLAHARGFSFVLDVIQCESASMIDSQDAAYFQVSFSIGGVGSKTKPSPFPVRKSVRLHTGIILRAKRNPHAALPIWR